MTKTQSSRSAQCKSLSPAAYDRWWKDRIEKEEGKSVEDQANAKALKKGGADGCNEVILTGDHLVGAGAVVKPASKAAEDTQGQGGSKAGSLASLKLGSTAGSLKGPQPAGTEVAAGPGSQAKTQSVSRATGSGTDSVIMARLARLEQDLLREKVRREAAEREMKALIEAASKVPAS